MSEVTSPPDGRPSDPAIVAAEPAAARSIAREFVRADRGRVLDIFETVYGREFRDNFDRLLDWQYLDNPYKPEGVPCSMVVEEDGRIVGFMGFYYSPTQVGPDVFPSCWIIGFVTDPDARGSAGPRFVRQASRSIDLPPQFEETWRSPRFWHGLAGAQLVVFELGILVLAMLAVLAPRTQQFLTAVADAEDPQEREDEP